MKVCAKCQAEYPDDMAFCSYCGTPLQPKIQENVCPACGKVVHAQNLRFCPYCGYNFNSLETKKNSNTKPPLPPQASIKKNYVKMQPLNQEKKPDPTPLQSDVPRNICPSCKSVIYAKNLNSCPYCGKSLNGGSSNINNHTPVSVTKPLPPDVNIKKNYVKMQPLTHADNSSNTNFVPAAMAEQTTNNNSSLFSPNGRRGRLNYFFVELVLVIVYYSLLFIINSVFRGQGTATMVVTLIVYIAYVYLMYCNVAKRFHDFNKPSSWAVAFLLVPIIVFLFNPVYGLIAIVISGLYPLFAKGTSGPNQYGDEP